VARPALAFRVSSRLAAAPGDVWERVASIEGVNAELAPWVRMTLPEGAELRAGPLGRSWILLAGLLPIDYDDVVLESYAPGRGFRERSTLGSASAWWHDRTLLGLPGGGCRVVDEIRFTPRAAALGGLQAFLFEAMFRWRHHRLRRHFGRAG
jgi:ligand-binding SRPBCC domain-containing protein